MLLEADPRVLGREKTKKSPINTHFKAVQFKSGPALRSRGCLD